MNLGDILIILSAILISSLIVIDCFWNVPKKFQTKWEIIVFVSITCFIGLFYLGTRFQ